MKRILIITLILLVPIFVHARPQKGFHSGPFITLDLAAVQVTDDYDKTIGRNLGHPVEPGGGFTFGWNINDAWAVDLNARYVTNFGSTSSERMHGRRPCPKAQPPAPR